jgi:hypothetical protein
MLAVVMRWNFYGGLDVLKALYEESTWKGFGITRPLKGWFSVRLSMERVNFEVEGKRTCRLPDFIEVNDLYVYHLFHQYPCAIDAM